VAILLSFSRTRATLIGVRFAELSARCATAGVVTAADAFCSVDDPTHARTAVRRIVAAVRVAPAELAKRAAPSEELARFVTGSVVDARA
jgi:hypothetical protein